VLVSPQSNTSTTAQTFIGGGEPGKVYLLTNRVTTSLNRTYDRSFTIRVEHT
jgi:hypothetical protein